MVRQAEEVVVCILVHMHASACEGGFGGGVTQLNMHVPGQPLPPICFTGIYSKAIHFNIDFQSQHNSYTVQICSPVSCWPLDRSFPGSLFLVSVKMSKRFQSK